MLDLATRGAKLAFVRQQLDAYSGAKKKLSDSTFVNCPFHHEKTPSGRIFHGDQTSNPGYFKCYGCGTTATWNNLAPKLGLQGFTAPKPKDVYTDELPILLPKTEEQQDEAKGTIIITGDVPRRKRWRTISTNLLTEIGAKLCRMHYKETNFTTEEYLYFPVVVRGKERGFIRARKRKLKGKPSYLNAPGAWSKHYGLFPLDYAIELMKTTTKNVLVLVEGPRDALRLLSYGIPAVAILGTQSWSDRKTKMLALSGVDTVVLVFDGDAAGKKARKVIRDFVKLHMAVKHYKFPVREDADEQWDPGNCPEEMILDIKRRLKIAKSSSGPVRPDGRRQRLSGASSR